MANKNTAIGGGGFHHVAIRVVNFDESVKFYTEGLGFTKKISWGENEKRAVMLDTGDGNYLEIFANGTPEMPSKARIAHFAIRTSDCDAAHARALAAGAVEEMAPTNVDIQNPGQVVPVRISFVAAPGGETIEFFQNELT